MSLVGFSEVLVSHKGQERACTLSKVQASHLLTKGQAKPQVDAISSRIQR